MPDFVKLNAAIDSYAAQAHGSDADDGELSNQRALALDAYAGKNIEPAPDGRSQVTDWTVFETVNWVMPSMMRIFAGGDNIVEFEPQNADDEAVAEQESDYLNYLVTQKNDWEKTVREWCQDALITKNAYCMVSMEEFSRPEIERYEGQREEQVTLLMEDEPEVVGQSQYDDPEDDGQLIDPFTQQPVQDEESLIGALATYEELGQEPVIQYRQLYDIEIKRVKSSKDLKFRVLPPERCKVGEDTTDYTLEECNYFEYWDVLPISDLRQMGYDVDDDISSDEYTETLEDTARDENLESDLYNDNPDPSMRQVVVRYIWIRFDYDEDGIAELQRVVRVGDEVLEREHASRIPVACIVPFVNTHRHMGNSIADLTFDIQRIKTAILRQGLDSMYLANNPMKGVSNKVDLDSLLQNRPGGVVPIDTDMPDVAGHVQPIVTPFIFPQAQEGLRHMDTVVESRVGVNRMFQGIDESTVNDHNRIGQLSTMAAQRVEDMARVFGAGFKRLFSLAHEIIIKAGHSGKTMKLRGQWVDIDPTQWKTGRDMRVVAPFAAGNKDSLIQRYMMIAQVQEKMLLGGMPTVDMNDVYNLASDMSKAADLTGDRYFTDPSTVEPQEPPPDHTMIALELESKKVENEAVDEERKAALEAEKIQVGERTDKYKTDMNAQLQVLLAQIKGGQQVNLEEFRASLREKPNQEVSSGEA